VWSTVQHRECSLKQGPLSVDSSWTSSTPSSVCTTSHRCRRPLSPCLCSLCVLTRRAVSATAAAATPAGGRRQCLLRANRRQHCHGRRRCLSNPRRPPGSQQCNSHRVQWLERAPQLPARARSHGASSRCMSGCANQLRRADCASHRDRAGAGLQRRTLMLPRWTLCTTLCWTMTWTPSF
jgi:hypothetical protein